MTSSQNEIGLVKKMTITTVMSVLYGAISISLDPRYAEFITEQDFGDIRPAIFFPAIISILYGPFVGGMTAAFGNLVYDAVTNIYFAGQPLEIDNAVGFLGNFTGAAVVGIFSKAYRYSNSPFGYGDEHDLRARDYFDFAFIRRLLRNTMAAVLGLSLVTGLVIGYGLRIDPEFTPEDSFIVFTSIAYWNGIFLLGAIPIIYLMMSVLDFIQGKKEVEELERRRNLEVMVDPSHPFEFVRVGSPKGDELWNLEWGALNMVIKNTDQVPHRFAVRIGSNDIFSPVRHTTPILQPGEEDEIYYNIYGITSGTKKSTIFVSVDDAYEEIDVPLDYKMGSSNELIFNKIMGMLLIIAFGVSIVLLAMNIRDNFVLDNATLVGLAALPIEIILVITFYLIWNNSRTKKLLDAMGFGQSEVQGDQMMDEVQENEEKLKSKIRRKHVWSTVYLFLSIPIFVFVGFLIVAEENDITAYDGDFVLVITIALVLILATSDLFYQQAEKIEKNILNEKELEQKIIRKAMTVGSPEIYKTTEIRLKLSNPFSTRGMRLFFHTIDSISPQELVIEDIEPYSTKVVTIDFTSLQEGKRKFSIEVVQHSDDTGRIIPIEEASTFDQEVVEVNVSSTKVLGLTQDQISLLRGAVAGIGSLSIAITFIANVFGFVINQQFLQTSLPLLIILQVPVLWLSLILQDKIKQSLNYSG